MSITLFDDEYEKLRKEAWEKHRSMSEIIREALKERHKNTKNK